MAAKEYDVIATEEIWQQISSLQDQTEKNFIQQMVLSVERNGYGKKWCFGPFHEIVSPVVLVNRVNKKHNALYYIRQNNLKYARLRLIVEEYQKEGRKTLEIRFVGSMVQYEAAHQYLDSRRELHRNDVVQTKELYNYDETEDGRNFLQLVRQKTNNPELTIFTKMSY